MDKTQQPALEKLYRALAFAALLKNPPEIPDDRLINTLVKYFWSGGRTTEALACIGLVEQRRPLSVDELNIKGFWQLYKGNFADASDTFGTAIIQDSNSELARLGKAYALFYLQDYSNAFDMFQKLASEVSHFKSPPVMASASNAMRMGHKPGEIQAPPIPGLPPKIVDILTFVLIKGPAEALQHALLLVEQIPPDERLPLQRLIVELYIETRQESQALTLIDELLVYSPDDGLLSLFKGVALRRLNQKELSHDAFMDAILLAPLDPRTWGGLAAGFLELNDFKQGVQMFRIAIFLDNNNLNFWGDMGIGEYALEHYSEAKEAFSRAIELGSLSFANYFNRGLSSFHLGQTREANEDWQYAILLEPGHPRVEEVKKLISDADGDQPDDRFTFGEPGTA